MPCHQWNVHSGFPYLFHLNMNKGIWHNILQMCENVRLVGDLAWMFTKRDCINLEPLNAINCANWDLSFLTNYQVEHHTQKMCLSRHINLHPYLRPYYLLAFNIFLWSHLIWLGEKIHYKKTMNIFYNLMQRKKTASHKGM